MFWDLYADKSIANGGELTHWDLIHLKKEDFNHYHVQGGHGTPRCTTLLTATSTPGED